MTETRPAARWVVLAAIAAAGLFLAGGLLQAFNEPVGLGDFTADDGVLLRIRHAADNANGVYVVIAAAVAAALPWARRRRPLRVLAAIAATDAALTVFVFVYDAVNRDGGEYFRIRRVSDGLFRLASLLLSAAVAAWAWEAATHE